MSPAPMGANHLWNDEGVEKPRVGSVPTAVKTKREIRSPVGRGGDRAGNSGLRCNPDADSPNCVGSGQ